MLHRPSCTALSFLALAAAAWADVDLSPKFYTVTLGEKTFRSPYFVEGDKKWAVTIDGETDVTEENGGPVFRFSTIPQARVQWSRSPVPATTGFAPETLPGYLKFAQSMLGSAAQAITNDPPALDVLPIEDWRSFRVVFAYTVGGTPARMSVTFVNISPSQQIVIVADAGQKHFGEVARRSDEIIRQWHLVQPGEEDGIN